MIDSRAAPRRQVLYLSHGGGPLPLLGDAGHRELVDCLQGLAERLQRPSAIVLISAHWEEKIPVITAAPRPELIYDYYGFPDKAYDIRYPCPGHPELARQVRAALQAEGMKARLDSERGFDHGLFVPLKLLYPAADIPAVQVSLLQGLSPETHLALGRALQHLDGKGLLVIGSGFSFHNMAAFFSRPTADTQARNAAFQAWLEETLTSPELSEAERARRLIHWECAPHARYCHPRAEHLLPLHCCYGLAAGPARHVEAPRVLNRESRVFLW